MFSWQRAQTLALLWSVAAAGVCAQTAFDPIPVARSACAAAANQYASQAERYSDALKLLFYETRDNLNEQAQRLVDLRPLHDAFKAQALRHLQTQTEMSQADVFARQVHEWVIGQLFEFAKEKYGQDKLFFKFFINNRCKQQFDVP